MKFVFLLCLLLGCALAQDGNTAVVGQWSGTTEGGRTFFPPNPASSTCAPVVDPRAYVVINSTFSAAGVRQVVLLAEPAFKPFVSVLLYNGPFNPDNSCTNFVRTLTNQNFLQASVGTVDDPIYFAAGTTYYFVVTSLNANVGKFSLQIFGSLLSGTSVGGPSWNPANLNNGTCVPTPGVTQSLSTVTWTQTVTGDFDLLAMFEAGSTSPSVYFALYEGSFTTTEISTNPCAGNLFSAIKIAGQEGDRAVPAYQFHLDINKIYTLAISNTYTGNWGFQVLQSRLKRVNGLSGYGQPNRGVTSCAANSTATNAGYFVQTFQAQYPLYFIDTYTIPSYVTLWADFPTYTFAYSGSNIATPPGTCPGTTFIGSAATGTTGGPLVLRTTVGSTYTVVVSTASGTSLTNANAAVQFYLFTGVSVGNSSFISPTTTGIAVTTSTSGTGVSSTGTTTSKNATSTSTSSTGSTTLTSGASHSTTTIFYIFSILSGLLFLLL